jgi:2-polyprenyl-3-methyl-5-hydroxy-6-metoxy-1,4-benzoquinol methylase
VPDRYDRQYLEKPPEYFGEARFDFVGRLPVRPDASILELGCGAGATGASALSEHKCARYVGIELDERAAELARGRLSEVFVGNVERLKLPFAEQSFDALIMSEVLEHLLDPWTTVRDLAGFLKPGGLVMASVPNISHHRIVRDLLKGRFELRDFGIMDRTHLRWFTPQSFTGLFEQAGIQVDEWGPVNAPSWKSGLFNSLTGGRLRHLTTQQINIYAHKKD